ncbi:hypothetical protein DVH24_005133 [Malus domestica]|uniref:Uncharacterized protein n=1 Tax=Malus domestica TaxID=3750 RepID=A0A498IDV6_MALDO|nr:hypothetical protein DVH24_005133 [Malus domestica]
MILSQNPNPDQRPVPLRFTTESYSMDRGPRYRAYAELKESRLRREYMSPEESKEPESKLTPLKKQVKFQTHLTDLRKEYFILAQSMPDFSTVLRKENRKPSSRLSSMPRRARDETPARYPPHQNPAMSMPERYTLIWEQNPTMSDSLIGDPAFSNASKIFRSSRFKMSRVQEELQVAQIEREEREREESEGGG